MARRPKRGTDGRQVATGAPTSPNADDRLEEIAGLLALAFLRLKARQADATAQSREQVRLDFAPRQSVDATTELEKEGAR